MTVQELIHQDFEGATRVVLEHRRHQRFRWVVLLELLFGLILFILLLPFLILLALLMLVSGGGELVTGSDSDTGDNVSKRFFVFSHELAVKILDKEGEALADVSWIPQSREAAEGLIAGLMASVDRQKLVLVEMLGGKLKEHMASWYGGKPLMASLPDHAESNSAEALTQAGLTVRSARDHAELIYREPARNRFAAIALGLFVLPLLPIALFNKSARGFLFECWLTALGKPPATWILRVTAESLTATRTRAGRARQQFNIHGRDLVGITFSPSLDFDREVTYRQKEGRILTRSGIQHLPSWVSRVGGHHVCDWLAAVTLRLRSERPELGLLCDPKRPTKCPYCGSIYIFTPGKSCPSCGGWAEKCH